jgi:hypothetical protein
MAKARSSAGEVVGNSAGWLISLVAAQPGQVVAGPSPRSRPIAQRERTPGRRAPRAETGAWSRSRTAALRRADSPFSAIRLRCDKTRCGVIRPGARIRPCRCPRGGRDVGVSAVHVRIYKVDYPSKAGGSAPTKGYPAKVRHRLTGSKPTLHLPHSHACSDVILPVLFSRQARQRRIRDALPALRGGRSDPDMRALEGEYSVGD